MGRRPDPRAIGPDAPLSNLFWQGLGWDADYLTFTRY